MGDNCQVYQIEYGMIKRYLEHTTALVEMKRLSVVDAFSMVINFASEECESTSLAEPFTELDHLILTWMDSMAKYVNEPEVGAWEHSVSPSSVFSA